MEQYLAYEKMEHTKNASACKRFEVYQLSICSYIIQLYKLDIIFNLDKRLIRGTLAEEWYPNSQKSRRFGYMKLQIFEAKAPKILKN